MQSVCGIVVFFSLYFIVLENRGKSLILYLENLIFGFLLALKSPEFVDSGVEITRILTVF